MTSIVNPPYPPYEGGSPKDRGFKPLTNGGSNDETTTELPHDDETTTELPHDDETTTQQQEPLSDYILKTNLLYFKSTPAVDMTAEHQLEILNSLGNFIKESKEKQDQLKADRFAELLKDKNETIDLIQTNAIKKDAVANGRVLDGKGIMFNTKKMLVSHIGNLPTILDYIGGKELADKFNFIPIETANRVNVKQKIDKVFKDMFNIIDKNKETSRYSAESLFKDYSIPLLELKVLKKDVYGNHTYREVKLKEPLETLIDKLILELQAQPYTEYNNISINYLNSLNRTAKRGGGRNYKYTRPST